MSRDKKALQILFDTYWSSRGWKRDQTTDAADFEYARRAGYMFDPVALPMTLSSSGCSLSATA